MDTIDAFATILSLAVDFLSATLLGRGFDLVDESCCRTGNPLLRLILFAMLFAAVVGLFGCVVLVFEGPIELLPVATFFAVGDLLSDFSFIAMRGRISDSHVK